MSLNYNLDEKIAKKTEDFKSFKKEILFEKKAAEKNKTNKTWNSFF